MNKDTLQIAITAIYNWQELIQEKEDGRKESPQFFKDTNKAIKELKIELDKSINP